MLPPLSRRGHLADSTGSGLMGPTISPRPLVCVGRGRAASAVFPSIWPAMRNLQAIATLARRGNMAIIEDSCHAIGAAYKRHDGRGTIGASLDAT